MEHHSFGAEPVQEPSGGQDFRGGGARGASSQMGIGSP